MSTTLCSIFTERVECTSSGKSRPQHDMVEAIITSNQSLHYTHFAFLSMRFVVIQLCSLEMKRENLFVCLQPTKCCMETLNFSNMLVPADNRRTPETFIFSL